MTYVYGISVFYNAPNNWRKFVTVNCIWIVGPIWFFIFLLVCFTFFYFFMLLVTFLYLTLPCSWGLFRYILKRFAYRGHSIFSCDSDSLATYGAIEMCFDWLIDWFVEVAKLWLNMGRLWQRRQRFILSESDLTLFREIGYTKLHITSLVF